MCVAFRAAKDQIKGIDLAGLPLKWLSYADDVVIFGDSEEDIATAWKALESATKALGLAVNPEKTKIMEVVSGTERLRPTAAGYRSQQIHTGHYRPLATEEVEVPILQWNEDLTQTELCSAHDDNAMICPDCSGDCTTRFYPRDMNGNKYVYTTSYRLRKHIREVHFAHMHIEGIPMKHIKCAHRPLTAVKESHVLYLQDPRRHGRSRMSECLGEGRLIQIVDKFKYLGALLDNTGNFREEIPLRIRSARNAFGALRSLLISKRLKRNSKTAIWKTYVLSTLLSGAATWTPTQAEIELLQRSINKQLKCIYRMRVRQGEDGEWTSPETEELLRIATLAPIEEILRERRLHLRRNILCKTGSIIQAVLERTWWSGFSNPQEPREEVAPEANKGWVIEDLLTTALDSGIQVDREALSRLQLFCERFLKMDEIADVAAQNRVGSEEFQKAFEELRKLEATQQRIRTDWSTLTEDDMKWCNLAAAEAEVPSVWNEKCSAHGERFKIPYISPTEEQKKVWESYVTMWTDGGEVDGVAGFGVVEGNLHATHFNDCFCRSIYGTQTNNRAEIAAVLFALQKGRKRPLALVMDSEMAIRSTMGKAIKGSEDLCEAVLSEMKARKEPTVVMKVWSHPERKGKKPNTLNIGNEMVDALASRACRKIPYAERAKCWFDLYDKLPREVRRAERGSVTYCRAEDVAQPVRYSLHVTADMVLHRCGKTEY